MEIGVYKNGEFVFNIDNPARLAGLVPLEEQGEFVLDADDLAAWEAEERIKHVRAEARRRMMVLLGARDKAHMDILISNGSREAIRLMRKGSDNWTAKENIRAAKLEALDGAMDDIWAASNALETMAQVPENFADEAHWDATSQKPSRE